MTRRWWSRFTEPSLLRGLLLTQWLFLMLLWGAGLAYVISQNGKDLALLKTERIYAAVMAVADDLATAPERQQHSLRMLDQALSADYGNRSLAPSIVLWQRGHKIYQSDGTPAGFDGQRLDIVETVHVQGRHWRTRTRQALGTGTRMSIIVPADSWSIFMDLNSRGYFVLPLLVSLPFLLLPSWLSIRLALRPWNKVAREIAMRGPQDLSPLPRTVQHLELATMVDSINALMQRVGDSTLRERSFIADAAHELRTPLAAMRVNVEALHRQASDERQRQLLAGILNADGRATRLVSQLLLMMRNEATANTTATVIALDDLLQDRLAVLTGMACAGGVELELSTEAVCIEGQREGLVSLIDNLVDNAIKYSPRGGLVRVELRREDLTVLLCVADQGPGIAPHLRERVFDRFFRDPNQVQSGSGLGLAIARAAAVAHGGQITLLPAAGETGLLVRCQLPLQ
jgi:two-component system sensor histidine kinase QseC